MIMKHLVNCSGSEIENESNEPSERFGFRLLLLTLVLLLTFVGPVLADSDDYDDDQQDNDPAITFTSVNFAKTQVVIHGERIHTGVFPTVILGRNGDDGTPVDITLTVDSIDTAGKQVIANIPSVDPNTGNLLQDGTYLITVITNGGDAEFHTNIGMVGAQGPQGPQGPQGIQGIPGPSGGTQSLDTTRAETTFTVPANGVNSGVATCPAGF